MNTPKVVPHEMDRGEITPSPDSDPAWRGLSAGQITVPSAPWPSPFGRSYASLKRFGGANGHAMRRLVLGAILLVGLSAPAWADPPGTAAEPAPTGEDIKRAPLEFQTGLVALCSDFLSSARRAVTPEETLTMLRRLAERGNPCAQFEWAGRYGAGAGVPHDYFEAAKWYRRAAEQGHPLAQRELGIMYWQNRGVPQDYVLAHMWLNLAAARLPVLLLRDNTIEVWRENVERKMTPNQIAEAQRMAREWLAQHQKGGPE